MSEPIDPDKDFEGADLDGIARRIANQAISSAQAKEPHSIHMAHLFREHIIDWARLYLGTVVVHERARAGRAIGDDIVPKP